MLQVKLGPVPDAELRERFEVARVVPFGRMDLAYAFFLPRGLEPRLDLAEHAPKPLERLAIGRFEARDAAATSITVEVYGTRREVSLLDLLAHDADLESIALERAELTAYGAHEAIEAFGIRRGRRGADGGDRGAGDEALRLVLLRQGAHVVRLTARAPRAGFDGWADRFAVALSAFRFKSPGSEPLIEPFSFVASNGPLPLGLRVSDAWRSREVPDLPHGRQAIEAALVEGPDLVAVLRADVFDADVFGAASLDKLAQEALATATRLGFQPARLRQRFRSALPGGEARADERGEVHEGRAFGSAVEVRFAMALGARAHAALFVIAPPRSEDAWAFMVARRALECAWATLNQPAASFAVSQDAVRALQSRRDVTPIYKADGTLDDRSFDGFDLADDREAESRDPGLEDRVVVERNAFEDELRRRAGR